MWTWKNDMILLRDVKGREVIKSLFMRKVELREGFHVYSWLVFLVLGRFAHTNQKRSSKPTGRY